MRTLALAACAFLAACTHVATSGEPTSPVAASRHSWTKPPLLRVGSQVEPNSLDPLLAGNTTEDNIDHLLFDGLVSVAADGKSLVPVLAQTVPTLENGGISRDGLTLTYHLRHGVRWHDGAPFTSADVKFSWAALVDPNNDVKAKGGYDLVRTVETPDPYTAVFRMKRKFVPAVNSLFAESDSPYEIVPAHLLARLHDVNAIAFNARPVGTGPFRIAEWVRGDHLTLVRNASYFLGAPKLERIVVRFVPDENTELNQLRTHDIDWQFEASPQEYKALQTIPDLRIVLQDRNEVERIQMNTKHPPLDDVRVRRAIAYGLDRRKLVDDLTFGSGALADQDLPPFMWAHAANVTRYGHDPAAARALLAQAGWKPGPDGVLVKNGQRLALSLVTNNTNATRRAAVVQVQSMLQPLGIAIAVKTYQGGLLFAPMGQNGVLQNGRFDLSWNGWVSGYDPDDSSLFTCGAQPPNGNNETHVCEPALDAAERDALTHFDIPTRTAAYARVETILTRDVPQLNVWWPRQIQPINPDLKNFSPNPVTETWNAYTWDI